MTCQVCDPDRTARIVLADPDHGRPPGYEGERRRANPAAWLVALVALAVAVFAVSFAVTYWAETTMGVRP